ncbi:unnamed protein product [Didymodactylos carnosus]|uniref:URB1 N-terminal domain-containing protein n=1 Tax=Didymodactylos carnosus TaxID=1234261 RepID=A0A8S2ECF3_9BILA|nr:unnamed protein product [Didymodactylos carnosus]CAF3892120.1 unnamed protein product [Didymodactylos carnosus]
MNLTIFKLILCVVFLISTLLCSLLPTCLFSFLKNQRTKNNSSTTRRRLFSFNTFLSCISCFGGGVFLGACLLDLLPDVVYHLHATLKSQYDYDNENTKKYPIAELLVAVGLFFVLFIEQLILKLKSNAIQTTKKPVIIEEQSENIIDEHNDHLPLMVTTSSTTGSPDKPIDRFIIDDDDGEKNKTRVAMARNFIMILSLIIHSYLEGIALGSLNERLPLLQLFLAIIIHKSIIAFSVGLKLVTTVRSTKQFIYISCIVFSLATPFGILSVLGVQALFLKNRLTILINDILRAFACGTFFYITFFDVLPNELNMSTNKRTLTEFNEHIRLLLDDQQAIVNLIKDLCALSPNLETILSLINEEKRKSSETTTLYRFCTTILETLSSNEDLIAQYSLVGETLVKTFISTSIKSIYFMLSARNTASHLKTTLNLLQSMIKQNEFCARTTITAIDFKRLCWRPLLKRRDVRDPNDVRQCMIKFFLSSLVYQHLETIRLLIKEKELFHDIFSGLIYDTSETVSYVLEELCSNVIMVPSVTKTDKMHLFDEKNLKSLLKLYHWKGERRHKDVEKEKKHRNHTKKQRNQTQDILDVNESDDEMDVDNTETLNEIRRLIHRFLIVLLNSKLYGIMFFDRTFGTSSKNANLLIFKVITGLSPATINDDYVKNLIVTCLTTCPDLLHRYFKFIRYALEPRQNKNWITTIEFFCEIIQQQKPVKQWLDIFENVNDPLILAEIFINLSLPMDIAGKFDEVIKSSDSTIQMACFKLLSVILLRVKTILSILNDHPLTCDRDIVLEHYKEAILRFVPKPDRFCESLNLLKKSEENSNADHYQLYIEAYMELLRFYSSCFLTISMSNSLDLLLSNSVIHLLVLIKQYCLTNNDLLLKYFDCIQCISSDSIEDSVWARQNKEIGCTPIHLLLKLARQINQHSKMAKQLANIIIKFSSLNENNQDELVIWLYTWLKLDDVNSDHIEQFLSSTIEKVILNPYPLLENFVDESDDRIIDENSFVVTDKSSLSYSIMLYAALDNLVHSTSMNENIDQYVASVVFQVYIQMSNPSLLMPSQSTMHKLTEVYLKNLQTTTYVRQLLNKMTTNTLELLPSNDEVSYI